MKTTEIPQTCPACHADLDMTSSAFGDFKPAPGDYTVCFECGEIAAFTDTLALRPVPIAERDTWEPETRAQLMGVQSEIHNLNSQVTP